ncbi:MAG: HAMP domain-containing sensor histidine kinase [Saprospiraceae bacterium]|nr:HAMP domain-containing sensor histidine kinase [Saprospiraceae bacterium]
MNNRTIQRIVLLGAIAVILVIASQTYWVMQDYNLKMRDFDRSVNIALQNVAQQFSNVNQTALPLQKLITRSSSNTYAVNVNSPINASNLDFFLRKHFEENALNEDFDYAVYDCHDERMMYGKYVSYTSVKDSSKVEKDFGVKLDDATYYFVVRFPKRASSILSNMSLTLVFTAISLLTVVFFIYSLTVILRQKRLSELQKDFINNMTHEFKTPISTIKVAADVFASTPSVASDPRLARYAQIIREQNNRLNTQVEKVLQLTRIDRNTLELNKEIINIHELLGTILPAMQVKIEEKTGILTQNLTATQPYIKADTLHLTNIIHNLLDNAVKYSKEGKPDIAVRTEDKGKSMRLTIADKGIGIDKEHQKKVFFRFYRVPTGDIHNVKGFGLGLFYVKNIIQAHGWQVELDSELGRGTTITIEIPKIIETLIPTQKLRTEDVFA